MTPQYECEPQTNPGTPSSSPSTTRVKYYLLPGIGDNAPTVVGSKAYSTYFSATKLVDFLESSEKSGGLPIDEEAPFADWKTKDLTIQGTQLAAQVGAEATGTTKAILIGHSMGGLRARSALQFNNATYPSLQSNVLAMVTLGTPHKGAPIINNGKPVATLLGGVFGIALGGFVGLGPYLPGAIGMFGARAWAASILDTPSGKDLRPGSPFLNRLNQTVTPNAAEKIPANVALLRVVGKNSDIDAYGASANVASSAASVTALRQGVGSYFAVAGGLALAMGFFTWGATVPWGLALLAASYLLLSLPAFWRNNVMGAPTGDGVVPEDSQSMPPNLGGRQLTNVFDLTLPQAVHTGRYGEYQAQSSGEYTNNVQFETRMQELQTSLSLPTSVQQQS